MLHRHALPILVVLSFAHVAVTGQQPGSTLPLLTPEVQARLGVAPDAMARLIPIATSKDEGYDAQQALLNAPDIVSLHAAHVGGQRLLFAVGFGTPPDFAGATFIIYLDLDNDPQTGRADQYHRGVDVMVVVSDDRVGLSIHNPAYTDKNTAVKGARVGHVLYVALDAPLPAGDPILLGVHLLSQRGRGRDDSTPHQVAQLPRVQAELPPLSPGRDASLRTLDEYRYHDDLVKYEKLEDKGLRAEQVTPAQPFSPGRPAPRPVISAAPRHPERVGSLDSTQVRVSLLEECGVPRPASPVSFGFPCPEGGVFDLARFRLLDADGHEIPAQFSATSFWPDDSLKWVLVSFLAKLGPGEEKTYTVELGNEVRATEGGPALEITGDPEQVVIFTGPLRVIIDTKRFDLFREVAFDADGDGQFTPGEQVIESSPLGMELIDEHGDIFSSVGLAPDHVTFEEIGRRRAVVRVEGHYGAADGRRYMRYIARLVFLAGSPRVTVAWTHVNDHLATEFTDFASLAARLRPVGGVKQASVYLLDQAGQLQRRDCHGCTLTQLDDLRSTLAADGTSETPGRAPGVLRCVLERGAMTVAVHDFWQRWPKAVGCDENEVTVGLLPEQPGPDYGTDLPHYLLFNLVSGKYRLKWGMAFTERFTIDFDPQTTPEALYADVTRPVVAVLPAAWYAKTQALGPVAEPRGQQFAAWDMYVAKAFEAHMSQKERTREYGFLNYGDWYGERGRNWGNNEYDLAHGLFQQFLRTGNRDYFRWALAAARHQADVDIIHAYPDPFYVGGMAPHSVGHTGTWSERLEHGTWHAPYDSMYTAVNGHNWADGMVDAWCLTGDAGIMDSALQLAEHITWAMSPTFKALGTHERSAGWSLRSIMAVYRQTYDPQYLAAARRIASVALSEQKFDEGGAWPHVLPLDHSNQQPSIVGNNLFLIGVLLSGLQSYHEATGDPEVAKSLISGVQWVAKSWDQGVGGWPYSATVDGRPLYPASPGLNMLIIQPVAYVANLTGDERLWGIVEDALTAVVIGGSPGFGKSLAQQLHFSGGILALLQERLAQARPDQGVGALSGDAAWRAGILARTPDATRHAVRAPDQKIFFVRATEPEAELLIERTPYGAMTKRSPTGMLSIIDPNGAIIAEDHFSTDDPHQYRCKLPGAAGARFEVKIDDDQRGVWTLRGDKLQIVMQTGPDFHIGGVGKGKYHFFVPTGTQEFRIRLFGVHTGPYGAVVVTPQGEIAANFEGTNPGSAITAGTPQDKQTIRQPERGEIVVRPATQDTGKLWSVVLSAAGDIGVELVGIPPYLSLSPQAWFDPTQ